MGATSDRDTDGRTGTTSSGPPTSGQSPTSTGDGESVGGEGPIFDVASQPDVAVDPPELEAVVYAHSSSVLYRLDPETLALDEIGVFAGCGSVVDIAVDRDNHVYASAGGIYEVDTSTAACTLVTSGAFGNNLSFVPPGVLDPEREILVTYAGTQYRSLDLETDTVTDLGTIPYSVSGDVVSINDGPTYVSVNFPGEADHLLLVDPTTGEMIMDTGVIGNESSVWGLGYWGGTVYGFSSTGNLTEITENADGTTTAAVIETTEVSFWGAGSSTFAPIKPPG